MRFIVSLMCLSSIATLAMAADWPQRSGPARNNSTPEIVRPWQAPLAQEWFIPLGEGYSSPTVAQGRLYLHHKLKDQDVEELLVVDAATGKEAWKFSYPHKPFESDVGNGPRYSPTIALGKVYAYGITGILTCLRADTGEKLWQKNVLEESGSPVMMFGATAGPLVDGNRLYVPLGSRDQAIAAFDTATGDLLWSGLSDPPTSVTPVMFLPRVEGVGVSRQVVYVSTRGLFGVDPSTGKPLWEFPLTDLLPISTLPPPTIAGDTVISSSMMTGTIAFQLEPREGNFRAVERWRNPAVSCYFSQGVVVGEQLYIINSRLIPSAEIGLSCLDLKTGREHWTRPQVGVYQLSLIRTGDNKLLMLDDLKGDAILLDPDPQGYRELARSHVCKPTIISPAVSNGRLYVRDDTGVTCYTLPTATPDP